MSEKNEKKIMFVCPVCDAGEYSPVYQNDGIIVLGGQSWIIHYTCDGCSVHFSDPEKFSKKA